MCQHDGGEHYRCLLQRSQLSGSLAGHDEQQQQQQQQQQLQQPGQPEERKEEWSRININYQIFHSTILYIVMTNKNYTVHLDVSNTELIKEVYLLKKKTWRVLSFEE